MIKAPELILIWNLSENPTVFYFESREELFDAFAKMYVDDVQSKFPEAEYILVEYNELHSWLMKQPKFLIYAKINDSYKCISNDDDGYLTLTIILGISKVQFLLEDLKNGHIDSS